MKIDFCSCARRSFHREYMATVAGGRKSVARKPAATRQISAGSTSSESQKKHGAKGPVLIGVHPRRLLYEPPYGKEKKGNMIELSCLGKDTIAYKLMSNHPKYYSALPNCGIIEPRKKTYVDIELSDRLSPKALLEDDKEHRFNLMAIEWPEEVDHFKDSTWDRLIKDIKADKTQDENIQQVHIVAEFDLEAAKKQLDEEQVVDDPSMSTTSLSTRPPPPKRSKRSPMEVIVIDSDIILGLAGLLIVIIIIKAITW